MFELRYFVQLTQINNSENQKVPESTDLEFLHKRQTTNIPKLTE